MRVEQFSWAAPLRLKKPYVQVSCNGHPAPVGRGPAHFQVQSSQAMMYLKVFCPTTTASPTAPMFLAGVAHLDLADATSPQTVALRDPSLDNHDETCRVIVSWDYDGPPLQPLHMPAHTPFQHLHDLYLSHWQPFAIPNHRTFAPAKAEYARIHSPYWYCGQLLPITYWIRRLAPPTKDAAAVRYQRNALRRILELHNVRDVETLARRAREAATGYVAATHATCVRVLADWVLFPCRFIMYRGDYTVLDHKPTELYMDTWCPEGHEVGDCEDFAKRILVNAHAIRDMFSVTTDPLVGALTTLLDAYVPTMIQGVAQVDGAPMNHFWAMLLPRCMLTDVPSVGLPKLHLEGTSAADPKNQPDALYTHDGTFYRDVLSLHVHPRDFPTHMRRPGTTATDLLLVRGKTYGVDVHAFMRDDFDLATAVETTPHDDAAAAAWTSWIPEYVHPRCDVVVPQDTAHDYAPEAWPARSGGKRVDKWWCLIQHTRS